MKAMLILFKVIFTVVFILSALCSCQRMGVRQDSAFGNLGDNVGERDEKSYYSGPKAQPGGQASGTPYNGPGASGASSTRQIEKLGQPKKRILVMNFWDDTPVRYGDMGSFAAERLRRELYETRRLLLPPDLKVELNTADFAQGDQIKVAQLIQEGRRLGVSALVIGRINKVVFRQRADEVGLLRKKHSRVGVDVEVKLFDVSAGREVAAVNKGGEVATDILIAIQGKVTESPEYRMKLTEEALGNAVDKAIPEIIHGIEKMAWEGRIARVAGSKVYLSAGRTSGLIGGDILKVLSSGDDIYDPENGAFLGRAPGQWKGTLEVKDFIGPDGAVAEIHTGGNFQEGDRVQLY